MQLKGLVTENLCGVKGYTTEDEQKTKHPQASSPSFL